MSHIFVFLFGVEILDELNLIGVVTLVCCERAILNLIFLYPKNNECNF